MRRVVNILMLMLIEDIKRLWLGGGYYGAPVVLEVTDTMSYRYVMRDHLGSITHVYTAEPIPTLLQELSYDAWGRLRNPDTHEAYASGSIPTPILGRGYTGHRYIAGIGLIDMNARLYDPMLGRFLSPDPHIQSPDCPQNYNRYTYCLNNPLRYTDPTGEKFTFRMQAYVNLFVESVNNRLSDLMKQLVKLMGKSDTKPETIQKLENNINECIDILAEINMLSESNQVYDIFCYDEESLLTVFKIPLNPYGYVTFSESLSILMVLLNGGENNIGLFAHELKHVYQFEVGEYSIGKPIADKQYPNLLYDRTDEYAAYERQNLFIDVEKNKYTKEDIDVSVFYVNLTKNIASYNTMEMFIYNINYIDNLWHFAKRYSHAFRINGVTYYPR